MKRITLIAVLLLAAACGDDGGTAATTTAAPATTAAPTTAAATTTTGAPNLAGQTIEVAAVWSGEEQSKFERVLDAFEAQTRATVNFTSTGDDIATVLGTRIQGGQPPDVAVLPQPGLMSELAGRGALQELDNATKAAVTENFAPVWSELGSVDGKLYGVWFKAANKSTFWYRVDALNEVGAQPPRTFEELTTLAQQLSDAGQTPFAVGAGDGWVMTDWFENVYIRSAGADMYDRLSDHEIPWTDDSVKTALTTMGEIFTNEVWIAGGASGALQTTFPESVIQVFGADPEAAMLYEGDFVATNIAEETSAEVGVDADFFPFPTIGSSPPSVVGGGDVAVLLTDKPAARELIKFLASPEAGEVWARLGGFTSPNKNVDPSVYPDDIARKSAAALTGAQVFRFDMSDLQPAAFGGTPGQGMWKVLQDFVTTPTDVDGIAQQLETARAAAG